MTTYHDGIYSLQDAVQNVLASSLETYGDGVAGDLPVLVAGAFEDRGRDHVYVLVEAMVKVGVMTLRDTSLQNHRAYCRAVFDLLHDEEFAESISETNLGVSVYQVSSREMEAGVISDAMRYAQVSFTSLLYLTGHESSSSSD